MNNTRTGFSNTVIKLIQSVPEGQVATYGLIAQLAGNPRGSRGVGWLLHSCTEKHQLPWHRIIKSNGQLPFPKDSPYFTIQKSKLEEEGVIVENGRVDLKTFLWKEGTG
ncbi:methylated-DNA--protein-cysteine methyltransferase [Legionella birminghamensis]|uniref:Methylated-DNA--protein-cysteine methyltransferase n=1 Tax=Legionella birminghamensis TaxID=28083 RepID=A0A378I9H8_9GAMM|nr:MGMT family protein [Legionella birminghamensis]KTC74689.1 methylated-DNA--protein-cysteine methyltransferase [Legionella birminghamensis]STX31492.1 methylated-DNA--protein-cysteine methyltransferase [Legionella birminghamensis]